MSAPIIYLFRRDLRLADNPALSAAVATGRPVECLFVLDDGASGPWKGGGASRWWLHYSLAGLAAALEGRGGRLILRRGDTEKTVAAVAAGIGADAVYLGRRYEPWAAAQEGRLQERLSQNGVAVRRFGGGLLCEPESVRTGQGTPFKVFTPFYRAILPLLCAQAPLPTPVKVLVPASAVDTDTLEDWRLLPRQPDWSGGLRDHWTPGEAGAWQRLERFATNALADYGALRDVPARDGTSELSPHLHFGEISPRQCAARVRAVAAQQSAAVDGAESFVRQLVWRDFSHHLLFHTPSLPEAPFRPDYGTFPWRDDAAALRAWQTGATGYPLVDAGMRQLWRTGWMHNRVRMVAASFLVKHLLIPWQRGEEWFWDTLVDADLANNAANWQWVAGCGADAAPYFRIFNPVTQSEKFDPDGAYLRRWLPELAELPTKHLHRPWQAAPEILNRAGVALGRDYPMPIVDHAAARARALAAFADWRRDRPG
ncbi:MAG: deoxyribodipyrimidine photo-lyase [Alphaproteobacteria bacterium]